MLSSWKNGLSEDSDQLLKNSSASGGGGGSVCLHFLHIKEIGWTNVGEDMVTLAVLRKSFTLFSLKYVRFNHVNATRLFLEEFGDPAKVVKKEEFVLNTAGFIHTSKVTKLFSLFKVLQIDLSYLYRF